ncbi:MAG: hypothetical protein B6D68_01945 [spirochete symbiont of Stewartia floridana]|nr:MAG: hypothetical protein B6D68_01945 [spirochete symbiont of Stewartia floridana]
MKDIHAAVNDVVNRDTPRLRVKDPIQTAISALDETQLSLLPAFDEDDLYKGIVSTVGISHFLMRENLGARPAYQFRVDNFTRVIPGSIFIHGDREEFTAPIMIGAMPFEQSIKRIAELGSNLPLLIVGLRHELVEHAVTHEFPALILTGMTDAEVSKLDFSHYKGAIYLSDVDTAETVRLLRFSTPLEGIIETDVPRLAIGENFDTAKSILTDSGLPGLPVFDGEHFAGVVTRKSFLYRPRNKIILVDHNELDQSIPGARESDILEIIDHHRFGAVMSKEPFTIYAKPVGCTCTIIRQLYRQHGIAIPTEIALLMMLAILSDTIILQSPTSTEEDRQTVAGLARHAGVDWKEMGLALFESGAKLEDLDPDEAVNADFKSYETKGIRFGIGQVEVQSLTYLNETVPKLLYVLERIQHIQGLDGTMLLITDMIKGDSILIFRGLETPVKALPYESLFDGALNLPGILSRKKQLLPEILRAIEETQGIN